ncbi:uncharacterized protein BDR25DRAFT_350649 [Lindgomyces ingoldianus]|uniref:Uncharacterized protein n=1 Tax=Lindgomyces ingoldianus TaxID=673940 RepID=A0ACB6R9R0_9PLEO|nr:uncharacterized protein BDR25DRAFT_350649 [Lindgomyces ingoldianus]KAF2475257.1 hypothetical protein BDR25DRAFT_350649 [Lindgomyces ingoldianus]
MATLISTCASAKPPRTSHVITKFYAKPFPPKITSKQSDATIYLSNKILRSFRLPARPIVGFGFNLPFSHSPKIFFSNSASKRFFNGLSFLAHMVAPTFQVLKNFRRMFNDCGIVYAEVVVFHEHHQEVRNACCVLIRSQSLRTKTAEKHACVHPPLGAPGAQSHTYSSAFAAHFPAYSLIFFRLWNFGFLSKNANRSFTRHNLSNTASPGNGLFIAKSPLSETSGERYISSHLFPLLIWRSSGADMGVYMPDTHLCSADKCSSDPKLLIWAGLGLRTHEIFLMPLVLLLAPQNNKSGQNASVTPLWLKEQLDATMRARSIAGLVMKLIADRGGLTWSARFLELSGALKLNVKDPHSPEHIVTQLVTAIGSPRRTPQFNSIWNGVEYNTTPRKRIKSFCQKYRPNVAEFKIIWLRCCEQKDQEYGQHYGIFLATFTRERVERLKPWMRLERPVTCFGTYMSFLEPLSLLDNFSINTIIYSPSAFHASVYRTPQKPIQLNCC